jgi:hypothetical protein
MIAAAFLVALGVYLACGLVFAIPFVIVGVKKIDPHAARGSWGFRLLIIPGAMAFWPLLLRRWAQGASEPPEECNAHRRLAQENSRRRVEAQPESPGSRRPVTSSPAD